MSQLTQKKTIDDVWPIRNKRFLLRVDYDSVAAPAGTNGDAPSSIPTIKKIVSAGGRCILMSHLGNPTGCELKMSKAARESALIAWRNESGRGMTQYFSTLTPKDKMDVLKRVTTTRIPDNCSAARHTGKCMFFATLTNDEKVEALRVKSPPETFAQETTLRPVVKHLQALLGDKHPVSFVQDPLNAMEDIRAMPPGSVVVLENLRFYRNESSPRLDERIDMARVLAAYADVYINDAFAASSSGAASITEVPRLMKAGAAGYLMEKEITQLNKAMTHPATPIAVIVGGNGLAAKLSLIRSLIRKVNKIFVAGEVSFPFLVAQKIAVGRSYQARDAKLYWSELLPNVSPHEYAALLLAEADSAGVEIVLPVDHVTHTEVEDTRHCHVTQNANVPQDMLALDLGPKTVSHFAKVLRECRTVLWYGPVGVAELESFAGGMLGLAQALAHANCVTIAGGVHTAAALRATGLASNITHVSTGGLSALHTLQGRVVPGADALSDHVSTVSDEQQTLTIKEMMRHSTLFSQCTNNQLTLIAKKAIRRCYAPDDVIIHDGDKYSNIWFVASGVVSAVKRRRGENCACRFVSKGAVIGEFEFLMHQRATETFQVVPQGAGVVAYQLSTAAAVEALNEAPDLGMQLLCNLSDSVQRTRQTEIAEGRSVWSQIAHDMEVSRTPCPLPPHHSHGREDGRVRFLSNILCTTLLHSLTLKYSPFKSYAGTCVLAEPGQGMFVRVALHFVQDSIYSHLIHSATASKGSARYVLGAALAAVATTPLRLMSIGIPVHVMTRDGAASCLAGATYSAFLSIAPAAAHTFFTHSRSTASRALSLWEDIFLGVLARLTVGFFMYPLVALRAVAMSGRVPPPNARMYYLLKQALALVIATLTHRYLERVARKLPAMLK